MLNDYLKKHLKTEYLNDKEALETEINSTKKMISDGDEVEKNQDFLDFYLKLLPQAKIKTIKTKEQEEAEFVADVKQSMRDHKRYLADARRIEKLHKQGKL